MFPTPSLCKYASALLNEYIIFAASLSDKFFCFTILSSNSPPRISSATMKTFLASS
jgi:hypothetical protein